MSGKVDKRTVVSAERLENLKKAREAAAEKKRREKEEKQAKDESDEKEKILNSLEDESEDVQPVKEVVKEIIREVPVKEKRVKAVPDDLDNRIRTLVSEVLQNHETKAEKKQRKLEEAYQYMLQRSGKGIVSVEKQKVQTPEPEPSRTKLSLFDY